MYQDVQISVIYKNLLCLSCIGFIGSESWMYTAPLVPNDTTQVIPSHSTTVSPQLSVSAHATDPGQSVANIQLKGNVYGISTNPQLGIEIITFTIGLAQQAPADVDLSPLEIAFLAPGLIR